MLTVIFIYLAVTVAIEMYAGSSLAVYDAEIGLPAGCDQVTTLSAEECWRRLIPFAALSTGGLYYLCTGW